jgi:RND family efflux transporter MFP subunit
MSARNPWLWPSVGILVLAGATAGPAQAQKDPPKVRVFLPVNQIVVDHEAFTGRTEAFRTVELRARVTGFLDKVHFQEGAAVKEGDLLFEIDARPYKAALAQADATVARREAELKLAETNLQRIQALLKGGGKGLVAQEEHDRAGADRAGAAAALAQARAEQELARLNLDFTRVRAPISGRVGRRLIDPGNLVKADATPLVTVTARDPLFVYFEVDERTILRVVRLVKAGKLKAEDGLPVEFGLADEKGFPYKGKVNFTNSAVDPDKGTLRVRTTLANPDGLLLPGLFVRGRMAIGEPYRALVVPKEAVHLDKEGKAHVLVVNPKNVIELREVELGSVQDGWWVVRSNLKAEDRVVRDRTKGVVPGTVVQPELGPADPR